MGAGGAWFGACACERAARQVQKKKKPRLPGLLFTGGGRLCRGTRLQAAKKTKSKSEKFSDRLSFRGRLESRVGQGPHGHGAQR